MKNESRKNQIITVIIIHLLGILLAIPAQGAQFFACACMWGTDNEMAFTQDTVPNQKSLTKTFDWNGVTYKVLIPNIHQSPSKATILYREKGRDFETEATCVTTIKTF